jgi:hypothetical protein
MLGLDSDVSNDVANWFKNSGGDLAVEISITRNGKTREHLSCETFYTNKNGDCVGAYNPTVLTIVWHEMIGEERQTYCKWEVCKHWMLDVTEENERLLLKAIEYMYSHRMTLFEDEQESKEFLDKMMESCSGCQMILEFDQL